MNEVRVPKSVFEGKEKRVGVQRVRYTDRITRLVERAATAKLRAYERREGRWVFLSVDHARELMGTPHKHTANRYLSLADRSGEFPVHTGGSLRVFMDVPMVKVRVEG